MQVKMQQTAISSLIFQVLLYNSMGIEYSEENYIPNADASNGHSDVGGGAVFFHSKFPSTVINFYDGIFMTS